MRVNLIKPLLALLIAGCAAAPKPPAPLPLAWAQQPEEEGKLPVGRIVAIEQVSVVEPRMAPFESQSEGTLQPGEAARAFAGLVALSVIAPLVIIASPAIVAAHALGAEFPTETAKGEEGNAYRHVIRLEGGGENIVRIEFWTYKIGDCVAVRSQPDFLVPALPGACR